MRVRLELEAGTSKKFWMVEVSGPVVTTTWGRIGAAGATKEQTAASPAAAKTLAERLAAAKRKKGYRDVRVSQATPPQGAKASPRKVAAKASGATDRSRLEAFFRTLDGGSFIALPPSTRRITQSAGHEDAAEKAHKRKLATGAYSYVFWHKQSHERAFDKEGNLVAPLLLHWGGDYETVRAALANAPEGLAIEARGEESAFEVRPGLVGSAGKPRDGAGVTNERAVRARLLALPDGGELQAEDARWLREVVAGGPVSAILPALYELVVHDAELSADLVTQATDRVQADVPAALAGAEEHRATHALETLLQRLHDAGETTRQQALAEACRASKKPPAVHAYAKTLRLSPTPEAHKEAGRLLRSKPPVDAAALASFILIGARLHDRPAADVALEMASDWRKMPGCTFKKAESLVPECLAIAAESIGPTPGDGYASLSMNDKLPVKLRRAAFDSALCWSLDASAVSTLVDAAKVLRAAKKTVAQLDAWHAAARAAKGKLFMDGAV